MNFSEKQTNRTIWHKIQKSFGESGFHFTFLGFCLSLPFKIQFNSLFVILLAVLYLLEGRFQQKLRAIRQDRLCQLFILFYAFHAFTLLNNREIQEGLFQLEVKFTLLLLPVILVEKQLSVQRLQQYLMAFVVACMIASLYCLAFAIYSRYSENGLDWHLWVNMDWQYFSYTLSEPIDIHPSYFSAYTYLALFLVLNSLFTKWSQLTNTQKTAGIVSIVYMFSFVALLAARTAFLAGLLVLITGLFLWFHQRKQRYIAMFVALIVLVSALVLYQQVPYLRAKITNRYGTDQRYQVWKASLQIIKQHWAIGVGAGDVKSELVKQYAANGYTDGVTFRYDPHNQYLQTWLSVGVIGLLILLAGIANFLIRAWRVKNLIGFTSIVFLMLCWLTESMLETQKGVVVFALFISIFAFTHRPSST